MVNNFYTLKALVREWAGSLTGCTVEDAFSQEPGEITLAFAGDGREWMIRASVERPFLFVFRSEGYSKARHNVATLFPAAFGRRVENVRIAERDRMLFIDLAGGGLLQIVLFGARANVLLVDEEGRVEEAFRRSGKLAGEAAPAPRAAPQPETLDAFEKRWRPDRNTTAQALSSAVPIFDRTLAAEAMHRAGVSEKAPADCTAAERAALFEAVTALRRELENPSPRIYWKESFPEQFALTALHHRAEDGEAEVETFESVDAAVRVFVRRRLAAEHFKKLHNPLEAALEKAAQDARRSAERMLDELSNESRAQRYERYGHLLMAAPHAVPAGAEEAALPDLFSNEEEVKITLDPARSAVENAERYYDKARRTRKARESAEQRLVATEEEAQAAEALLEELRCIETLADLKTFRKEEAARLAPYLQTDESGITQVPFRRFDLGGGYEVWVGRNARQNDDLTFHHAQKYDLWMHARGMPGSHTVLRLPSRDAEPPKRLVHTAASIAAHYSKGRGAKLVPVMVTRRKYVSSPRGAAPGGVRVEREEVVLVEPRLPSEES